LPRQRARLLGLRARAALEQTGELAEGKCQAHRRVVTGHDAQGAQ